MKLYCICACALAFGLELGCFVPMGHAQTYNSGYHVDHHDHVGVDSHGHVRRYHHDVIHPNSTYVVPSNSGSTYYYQNGQYYYYDQPHVINSHDHGHGHQHVTHRPVRPNPVQFGGFSHVDDLVMRLETLMNDLCLDMHYNYQHNPGFEETYAEAYEILETAKYIHDAEHANDRQAISERLEGMDAEFHHIEDDVRSWHRHHHRQVGSLGIITKMELIEAAIHHLMHDVGVSGSRQPTRTDGLTDQAPPPY